MASPSRHTPARFSQQNWEEWHTSRLPPHTGPIRPVSVIFCKIPARVQPDPPTPTTAHLALQSGTGSARQCEPTACSTPRSRIPLAPSCTQLVLSLNTTKNLCLAQNIVERHRNLHQALLAPSSACFQPWEQPCWEGLHASHSGVNSLKFWFILF